MSSGSPGTVSSLTLFQLRFCSVALPGQTFLCFVCVLHSLGARYFLHYYPQIPDKLLKNHGWIQTLQSTLLSITICNKKEHWILPSTTGKRSVKLLPMFTSSSSLYNGFLLQTSNMLCSENSPIDAKMSSAYKTNAGYMRGSYSIALEFCIFLQQCSTF